MTRQNWGAVAGPPDPVGSKQQARPNSCRLPKKRGPFRELFQLWLGRFEHLFFNGRDGGKIAEDFSAAPSVLPSDSFRQDNAKRDGFFLTCKCGCAMIVVHVHIRSNFHSAPEKVVSWWKLSVNQHLPLETVVRPTVFVSLMFCCAARLGCFWQIFIFLIAVFWSNVLFSTHVTCFVEETAKTFGF